MKNIYKLYQNNKLMFTGDQKHLSEMTGLKESTIRTYCKPGYFDDKKNENKTKIVKVGVSE